MKKVNSVKNVMGSRKRAARGFSIVELLVVVAILLVLSAIGFIVGDKLIKNTRQSHLDKRAEAVYYAAQSRMMELFVAQEKSDEVNAEGQTISVVKELYNANKFSIGGNTQLAYLTSDDGSEAASLFFKDKAFNDKFFSAERGGTSIVIEYDPVSLDVYAAVVCDEPEKAGTSIAALAGTDLGSPLRGTAADRIAAYNAYVGYYSEGATGLLGANVKGGLSAGAWIINSRDLLGVVKITIDENTRKQIEGKTNIAFKLTVKGEKSSGGNSSEGIDISANEIRWQNYSGDTDSNYLETDGTTGIVYTTGSGQTTIPVSAFGTQRDSSEKYGLIGYIKLDSLDKDMQFNLLKTKSGGNLGSQITPGDDISISFKVWDTDNSSSEVSKLTRGATAVSNVENSLYADFDVDNGIGVAQIIYPRHLQNLAKDFSKVESRMAAGGEASSMAAVLLDDIDWAEDENKYPKGNGQVRNFTPITNSELRSFNGDRTENNTVNAITSVADVETVNPEEKNSNSDYTQNDYHVIRRLKVDTSDSYAILGTNRKIGLFGDQNNIIIANLVITEFKINNTVANNSAGMLAGRLTGSTVKNVFAYNSNENIPEETINGSGNTAGIIGEADSCNIDGVVIKNLCVKSSGGAAGALIGKGTGSNEIKNVLAYNGTLATSGEAVATTVDYPDEGLEITGSAGTGGLIGEIDGGRVTGCAAALYVRSTGGMAGGLVGMASNTSIDESFSGGHTITENDKPGKYGKETSEGTKGRINVIGSSSAGGFVGTSAGATIQNSYSTCSASASTVGGFAGTASGGNITNCYAVGQVLFETAASTSNTPISVSGKGGFIGSGGASLAADRYFELINQIDNGNYLKGIGGTVKDENGIKAIDDSEISNDEGYEYNKFMLPASELTILRGEKTHRYDSNLQPAIYGFPFVSKLRGGSFSELFFVDAHYGDWPIVETFVKNPDGIVRDTRHEIDPFAVIKAVASDIRNSDVVRALAEAVITEPIPEEDLNDQDVTTENQDSSNGESAAPEENTTEQEEQQENSQNEGSGEDQSQNEASGENQSQEEASGENQPQEEATGEGQSQEEASGEGQSQNEASGENQSQEEASGESQPQNADNASNEAASSEETANNSGESANDANGSEAQQENTATNSEEVKEENENKKEETAEGTTNQSTGENGEDTLKDILSGSSKNSVETTEKGNIDEKEYAEEKLYEGVLEDKDRGIAVYFGTDANIPEGAELCVTDIAEDSEDYDYGQLVSDATEAMEIEAEDVASYRLFDLSIQKDGEEIQPEAPVYVEIQADGLYTNNELFADDELAAVHMKNEEPQIIEADVTNEDEENGETDDNPAARTPADKVSFETDGFSVFVLVQPVQQKTVIASDESVYSITVDYDNASGIPANAELTVSEVTVENEEYAGYIEESAKELGTYSEYVRMARIFDISFVDKETGDIYQPTKDVKVSVQLIQDEIGKEDEEIKVVHFGDSVEAVESAVNDGIIEFAANSFSNYTIVSLPNFDVFDTALDGSAYYISYVDDSEEPSVIRYLSIKEEEGVKTLSSTDDSTKATAWSFKTEGDGYQIFNGTDYLTVTLSETDPITITGWHPDTEENSSRFTVTDWDSYHRICLAKSNEINKYLGYGATTDYVSSLNVSAEGTKLVLSEAVDSTDIGDRSLNGQDLYITAGGQFLKYDSTGARNGTTVPFEATAWTFTASNNGYRIHNGSNYIGFDADTATMSVKTNCTLDRAARFRIMDMGDYHVIESLDKPGYCLECIVFKESDTADKFRIVEEPDMLNVSENSRMLLIQDVNISGEYVIYSADNKYGMRNDIIPVNRDGGIQQCIKGEVITVANGEITSGNDLGIFEFIKQDEKFGYYIVIKNGEYAGKYLNITYGHAKRGNVSYTDNPQMFYISTKLNGRIRITTKDSQYQYSLNYKAKSFQAHTDVVKNYDDDWFNLAADSSSQKVLTINYVYGKATGDKGLKNNLPLATTEEVSIKQNESAYEYTLKDPVADKYVSMDSGKKYTYEFVGWKIKGYAGTLTDGSYIPGDIVDFAAEQMGTTITIKAVWKLVKEEALKFTIEYNIIDSDPGYSSQIDGGSLPVIDTEFGGTYTKIGQDKYEEIREGEAVTSYKFPNVGYEYNGRYVSYMETVDPDGYFGNKYIRTYQKTPGEYGRTYLFRGWRLEDGSIIRPYDLENGIYDLTDLDNDHDEKITLVSSWACDWKNTTSAAKSSTNLSILSDADQIDNPISAEDYIIETSSKYVHLGPAAFYSTDNDTNKILFSNEINSPSKGKYKYFVTFIQDMENYTQRAQEAAKVDKKIREELAGESGYFDDGVIDKNVHDKFHGAHDVDPYEENEKNRTWHISYLPSDEFVFKKLQESNLKIKYYDERTGTKVEIPKEELTPENYLIRWFVVKYQSSDVKAGFHVNGKITKKVSSVTITKTFKGDPVAVEAATADIDTISDTDSEADVQAKIAKAKNRFNITLKNAATGNGDSNANDTTSITDDTIMLTMLDRVSAGSFYAVTTRGKVDTNIYGFIKKTEKDGNITYTWVVPIEGNQNYIVKENNYTIHLQDSESEKEIVYGAEVTFNQTNTGDPDDEEYKPWNPEKRVKTNAEPLDAVDMDDNESTNFINTMKKTTVLNIKKVTDTKEPIKNVEFRIFKADKADSNDDALRLYNLHDDEDGEYSLLYENKEYVNVAKTNAEGLLKISIPQAEAEKTDTYIIKETIPEEYQGHNDTENIPQFKITIDDQGDIRVQKQDVKMKTAYGSIKPCNDDQFVPKEYDEQGVAKSEYFLVTNSNGVDISFKKIDGYGEPLAGAEFTFYDTSETGDANTFAGVLENNGTPFSGVIIKEGENEVTTEKVVSTAPQDEKGNNVVFKIPAGIYFMKETKLPDDAKYEYDYFVKAGDDPDVEENRKQYVYKLYVGEDNVKQAKEDVSNDTGLTIDVKLESDLDEDHKDEATKFVLVRMDKDNEKIDKECIKKGKSVIEKLGIINLSKAKCKVVLKKTGSGDLPYRGPKFDILRADLMSIAKNIDGSWISGDAGAFFIGKLGVGKYYLVESASGGAGENTKFEFEVKEDSDGIVRATEPKAPDKDPFTALTE
ncbi:SpaA isopeptide-forming pilin-related protein [Butyrivibrio sp. AC2005]|uniref:SpaA isopeptide-forming pilin-related protein n=1 Tax=Butyrivibrio sp. AC2005 TaxID=1280672 RepID=UPI0003F676FD|nr:SpaA isopeptide-forming pilin-related protein [Butyrivibrio sp. AC2005]